MLREALDAGEGILRLAPTWVPRALQVAGGRLRLAPQDLYSLGPERGAIGERWFASTTNADNGPGTPADEGLSYVDYGGKRALLREAIAILNEPWEVLCKFFDNQVPIAHHMHQSDEQAARLGRKGKPEAYYFPAQYNVIQHSFPYTFLGLEPGTTKAQVRDCLGRWNQGDNGILNLSRAYRLETGTGWQIDPGILHAPGTLVTYEPQRNSDVGAFFQSMVWGRPMPWRALIKDVPPEHAEDLDFIVDQLDWEANVDPCMKKNRFRPALKANEHENWIVYGSRNFSAKELRVPPGATAVIRDSAAHGAIVVQGHGVFGPHDAETPQIIRYGEMTRDEYFVTSKAAREGVRVVNRGREPLVILKHFAPDNPDAKELIR
jgi:hypothetical protein